ncbi:MAG: hypothetical protein ABJL54_12830 [Halioglobus sp.]|jgi:hypothetical protein
MGKTLGLVATAVMFAFSTWMFQQTGDWVAAVFAVGSLAYGVFFFQQKVSS